jgi:hypothetical protein
MKRWFRKQSKKLFADFLKGGTPMKAKWITVGRILIILLLALAVGMTFRLSAHGAVQAQDPQPPQEGLQPQGEVTIQALMGTAFTYQGQLKKDGNPVNGNCDFVFSLWNAESGGTQIGSNLDRTNVPVINGLFTIQLDFGTGAFQGEARWLRIRVRCPAGSGDYAVLEPRQPLTPAPYALALPGLWTQQNATSPNLIGGYSGNSVNSGVVGATISGGGQHGFPNRITSNFGVVGGGLSNTASEFASTVGGGSGNTASMWCAMVGGGEGNTASGYASTVGGGRQNTANTSYATVGGGRYNSAKDFDATIGGGAYNTADGMFATVPGGYRAAATHYGEMAYAAGMFVANGDAQTSTYVARIERDCTAGTWYDLYLNGNDTPTEFLTIAAGRTLAFDALVVGRTQTGESAGYYIRGVVENRGGTVSFIGTPVVTTLGEDDGAWDVKVVAHNTYGLVIQVQGNGETIRWVATVRTVEVSW